MGKTETKKEREAREAKEAELAEKAEVTEEQPVEEVTTNAETQPSEATEEEAETSASEETAPEEPVEEVQPLPTPKKGNVIVKVLVGTLQYEGGIFQHGETFEVSKKRAALFDPADVEILG